MRSSETPSPKAVFSASLNLLCILSLSPSWFKWFRVSFTFCTCSLYHPITHTETHTFHLVYFLHTPITVYRLSPAHPSPPISFLPRSISAPNSTSSLTRTIFSLLIFSSCLLPAYDLIFKTESTESPMTPHVLTFFNERTLRQLRPPRPLFWLAGELPPRVGLVPTLSWFPSGVFPEMGCRNTLSIRSVLQSAQI